MVLGRVQRVRERGSRAKGEKREGMQCPHNARQGVRVRKRTRVHVCMRTTVPGARDKGEGEEAEKG